MRKIAGKGLYGRGEMNIICREGRTMHSRSEIHEIRARLSGAFRRGLHVTA